MRTARTRRTAATLAINLLVFVVLAELVALAIYYVQTGGFFYLHRPAYTPPPEIRDRALTASALHPYFGHTHKPGHPFSMPEALAAGRTAPAKVTNNFGFVSAHDYPYAKQDANEFVVGVFGGSVGVWFCELGAERLLERLRQTAALAGRRPVALCFSHEGYKQPQQLLALAYFLSIGQEFDLVVNIDGFNEVALGSFNEQRGLDFSMPSAMHLDPLVNLTNQATLTPEKLASLAAIAEHKRRLNALAERINANRMAAMHIGLEQYYRMVTNRLVAEQFRFAALPSNSAESSLVYVTPKTRNRAGPELFDAIARAWVEASSAMNQLLAARSIAYVHVLQPNQYYTRRRFEEAERRVAINPQSPFKDGVERGYPVLTRTADSGVFAKLGVRFVNATGVLDAERSAVYMDDCCHYTTAGNRLLADHIAERIAASDWLRRR